MAQTVQAPKRCFSCGFDLPFSEFQPTLCECDPQRETCNICMEGTVDGQLKEGEVEIPCDVCANPIPPEAVLGFLLEGELRNRYEEQLLLVALLKDPEYHECLNPQCNSGQLHPLGGHPRLRCCACQWYICTRHEIPWHDGFTCDEFDAIVDNYASSIENWRSEDEIEWMACRCPDCGIPIEKIGDYLIFCMQSVFATTSSVGNASKTATMANTSVIAQTMVTNMAVYDHWEDWQISLDFVSRKCAAKL
ncbi:hypothetical protein FKW77_009680 [Venturia effusa]|uniref:IBR domain-containing protein n=1 Tax=Venturia effusa TaxID=50376 RepID=A0A517L245_9PEZI|nr:hypothetical protein FKW77_009680 [Venturia effusa]